VRGIKEGSSAPRLVALVVQPVTIDARTAELRALLADATEGEWELVLARDSVLVRWRICIAGAPAEASDRVLAYGLYDADARLLAQARRMAEEVVMWRTEVRGYCEQKCQPMYAVYGPGRHGSDCLGWLLDDPEPPA